jgi:(p)ppGpp synthase/HD superfamily hydrolase
MTKEEKIQWIIEQHKSTNHFYDTYLPYEFHLRMVSQAGAQFMHIMDDVSMTLAFPLKFITEIELALWGHDLIEDTRTSYNDVKKVLGSRAADIIYACTNEKGKTRSERANYKYYDGIYNTPYATFVKLCDRIANSQYSKMTKSEKFSMYQKENDIFLSALHLDDDPSIYKEMVEYLKEILEK